MGEGQGEGDMNATVTARQLRRRSTDAERKLWSILRNSQLAGYKFRRQVPIGNYIVDFVCFEKKIVVELDGGQHQAKIEYDNDRTRWLQFAGFRVIRFWNNQVLSETDAVLQSILITLTEEISPSP